MAVAFPSSPTTGDTHTTGGQVWTFNGSAWAPPATSTTPTLPWTPIAALDELTPPELTFHPVHYQRSRSPLPIDGPHVPFREEFQGAALLSGRYTVTDIGGTPTSVTEASGKIALVGNATGGSNRNYHCHTKLASPSGVFACIRVDPGFTGASCYATVGFGVPGANGDYIEANWRLDTGALNVFTNGSAGKMSGSTSAGTLAGPTTAPIWLGLILTWPSVILVTSLDGVNWDTKVVHTGFSRTISPLVPAQWSPFRPYFKLAPLSNSGTVSISGFRAGYAGSYGYLNQKVVTLADGTPYKRDGKHYLTCTVPTSPDFFGQHMAILSFDPVTYQTDLVTHVLFAWDGLVAGASVGTVVYDDAAAIWHVVAATWGIGAQSTGVEQIYGTTTQDLLSPGVAVINAASVVNGSTNSVYDAALRRDDAGLWHIAAIETDAPTNWTTFQPRYYTATDLATWTLVASDNIQTDGTQWAKIGNVWYVLGGTADGFRYWDATLGNRSVPLSSWVANAPSGLVEFGGFAAHPGMVVTDDGTSTRYILTVYDASTVSGSGTRGGHLVLEAAEKPAGQEFEPHLIVRYDGC